MWIKNSFMIWKSFFLILSIEKVDVDSKKILTFLTKLFPFLCATKLLFYGQTK